MSDETRVELSDSVNSISKESPSESAESRAKHPFIAKISVTFFIITWLVFAVIGLVLGVTSHWSVASSILLGIVSGFIISAITTTLDAFGVSL